MRSRLSAIAPDVEVALSRAAFGKSNEAALAAARLATQTCNLAAVAPRLVPTLENVSSIDALVETLDAEYFSAHEKFENGLLPESAYLVPFCRARAASALAFALRGEASEAVYEAIMATDDPVKVSRTVEEALANEGLTAR